MEGVAEVTLDRRSNLTISMNRTHPQPPQGGEQNDESAEPVPLLGGVRSGFTSANQESPFVISLSNQP